MRHFRVLAVHASPQSGNGHAYAQNLRQDRELSEWKEAFDELEKERDEALRKACERERADMKGENDAVHSFLGKVLEENDMLQEKVTLLFNPSLTYVAQRIHPSTALCWQGI